MALKTLRQLIIGLIILTIGFGGGYRYREWAGRTGFLNSRPVMSLSSRENIDFTLFWQVWDTLQAGYIDPDKIDYQDMVYGAIQGMTAALGDPYTVFLPPEDNQQTKEDLSGEFDGVGIQLGYKNGTLAVMTPLEDHPAIKAGVRAGDLILQITDDAAGIDEDTRGMSLPEAVKLIRGKKGTPVTLTLYREERGRFDVTITRETITIPSVALEIGDWTGDNWQENPAGTVAWLKLHRFGELTQAQWDAAVSQILSKKPQLKGIVLDVRNNPGGYLNGAIDLSSEFIPEGKIVTQEGRFKSETFTVTRRARLLGMPLVVLINGGSASASEIMAGALRDRLEVKLVGERSFGKGTVQEALDLKDNAGLHLTTARWLLPSGSWIHDEGLEPDIAVELPDLNGATTSADLVDTQLKAAIEAL